MKKLKLHFPGLTAAALYTLMAGQSVLADDTEVLVGPGGQAWATPNVLFIMDTSGSMGDNIAGGTPTASDPSRLSIVQGVFSNLMTVNSGFNVGLMRFDSGGQGGYFVSPMQTLDTNTRAGIIAASDNFSADGNTPLSETLYEATRFYRGMSVDYGDSSSPDTNHPDVVSGANYISPITSQCQKNFIILLTDGEPTSDGGATSNIQDLTGNNCNGNCLDELAGFLHTADQSSIAGTQTVETYTIGFATNQTLLQNTATNGGGSYMTANNATELGNAFSSILQTITDTNDTFSPPAIAANAFNNTSHYNRLYFTLFEPAASPKWEGNVKPYALNDNFELVDADNNVAVDSGGFFLETSRSFWSTTDDGGSIADGGANGQLPTAISRNLYTYTGNYSAAGIPDSPALSAASNALLNSASLTADMLGLTNPDAAALDAEFNNVLGTIRASTLSDPLHSRPALINYGGTASNPVASLFVATNAGFLHALNASTGVEQFAFIPQELLTNLPTLASSTGTHPYGLDGDVTTWVNDINNDGDVSDSGEHAYIYVGMRRGGNNYYALDVTNINAPTLKWVIQGGPSGNPNFTELGQSWSRPIVTTINYGSATRTVLIFGGGYDTAQDANPIDADDTIGRAIYIVDADTGQRLWWAGPTDSGANFELDELTNSIPSDIKLIDSNLDGYTDRLYVGDMRGQIFRFDLQANATGVTGSGIRLANLGGTTEANNRRFYYAPDIVFTQQHSIEPYISINIGSGYRAHPLNPLNADGTPAPRVNDRFYSLRDPNVFGAAPADFTALTDGDLFDATSTLESTAPDLENGWYITLGNGNGEKVLASAITLNGEILFTTYTPPTNIAQSDCAPPPGVGRLYRVNLFDATPTRTSAVPDINGDLPAPTVADRVAILERPGIPSSPTIVFREIINEDGTSGGTETGECVGTDCNEGGDRFRIEETYWRD